MSRDTRTAILLKVIEDLELPNSAYEKAVQRYEDLGDWFSRDESTLKEYDPHIFPQGSFRLGTATKPIGAAAEYDIDLSCKLRSGVTKASHTQKQVKEMVRVELEAYRKSRGISAEIEPKHRCWRLEYQDHISFHIDIVPCIPEDESKQRLIEAALSKSAESMSIATDVSKTTVAITDDRDSNYQVLSPEWKISNPEGYAKWFESRMSQGDKTRLLEKAQVDEVPLYKRKEPLQRVIQLLKRHRDLMFKENDEVKPISIIVSTLAARAYGGESDIGSALTNILSSMEKYVGSSTPRVPNPVDPEEDFADRWAMPQYRHLRLEHHFRTWLIQAKADFESLINATDAEFIAGQADRRLALKLDESELKKSLGLGSTEKPSRPSVQVIREGDVAKPWRSDS